MAATVGDTTKDLLYDRVSAYVQDAFTVKNRATINVGVRLDSYTGGFGGCRSTGPSGLPFKVGQTVLQPALGFNPLGPTNVAGYNITKFTTLSPRVGVSYDLTGDGKTALKASFSRYTEAMPVMRIAAAQVGIGGSYTFDWWDLNGNGTADDPGTDRYAYPGGLGAFAKPDIPYLQSLVASDLKSPYYNEITASLTREVAKNLSVRVQYINKSGYNDFNGARFDTVSKKSWYKYEQAPQWWVPFTTTVPAVGIYPARTVTVYYMSQNAPRDTSINKYINSPDTKRNYNAIELDIDKRFSNGWTLGGSIVYSALKTITGDDIGDNPNQFINGYGRSYFDVPLAIKLYGSVRLPLNSMASFFYRHVDGTPYNEWVGIYPPDDWIEAHNAYVPDAAYVALEPSGTRRQRAYDNTDLRLQKDLKVKIGTLAVWVDVFNVFGNRYDSIGVTPDGSWFPTGVNTTDGRFETGGDYGRVTGLSGSRVFKFSARLTF
jgi:hypothetical protein